LHLSTAINTKVTNEITEAQVKMHKTN